MAIIGYWKLALLGLDGLVVYVFYKAYKHYSEKADVFEELQLIKVGPELYSHVDNRPKKCIPYVGICGLSKVSEDATILTSNFHSGCLIHKKSKIEHKSIAYSGFWENVTKPISSVVRSCRFGICAPGSFSSENDPSMFVEVKDPLKAKFLMNNLPSIRDDFIGTTHKFNKEHRKNREYSTGYQYKEFALFEGVPVFGVGKIFISPDTSKLCFGPPDLITNKYIFTTLTKAEMVNNMRKTARRAKYCYYTFLFISAAVSGRLVWLSKSKYYALLFTGAGVTAWMAVKFFNRNPTIGQSDNRNPTVGAREKVDIGVNTIVSMSTSGINIDDTDCTICWTSKRNIFLLPCKHLNICSGCYDNLSTPKKCPMCMALVEQCSTVYM